MPKLVANVAGLAMLLGGCAGTPSRHDAIAVVREAPVGVQVVGRGEAEAQPDVAVFRIGVEARMATVEQARAAAAKAQQAVLAAIKGLGVSADDLQTTMLTVAPEYDYTEQGRILRGYAVANHVEVRMRDVARVSQLIDAGLAAAGDLARLDSLTFELSDPSAPETRAREQAMQRARSKAEQLATLLGVRLGAPISVEEMSSSPVHPVAMRMEQADASAATPVEPGTTRVEVELRVQWAIVE
jgi:uncharacterized protein YggE